MEEIKKTYYRDGTIKSIKHYRNKKLHNREGPAYTTYKYTGEVDEIRYYIHGVLHREGGPTKMYHLLDAGLVEEYSYKGKSHREGKPAFIFYYPDGCIESETYCYKDKLHRLDGPAVIAYNEDGTIEFEEFFINGKRIFDPLEFYCEAGEYERSKNEYSRSKK